MEDLFDAHFLDPNEISLQRSKGGALQGVIEGREYTQLVLMRVFPLTKPYEYISVRQPNGEEIGIVKDLSKLDTVSLSEAELELRLRYLIPVVTRIHKIAEEAGLWIWDLQTDRGPLQLAMRNLHEHVQSVSSGRLLITDMDGRRCEIRQIGQLDSHSKKQLSKIL
jgi:hypothetical protein